MFSPKVDPEDVLLVSVLLEDGLEALLETLHRGLTSTKEGEARQLKNQWSKFNSQWSKVNSQKEKRKVTYLHEHKNCMYRRLLTRSMAMAEVFP